MILAFQKALAKRLPYGWLVVFASLTGLAVCAAPLLTFTFSIFIKPLSSEFGWTRGATSAIMSVHTLALACTLPIAGFLIDKHGPRRVVVPVLFLFGAGVFALSLLGDNLAKWFLAFGLLGILGALSGPIPYATALVSWFDRRRGLALGIAISGVGIGGAVFPVVAQSLIDAADWRYAYRGLALAVGLIGLPVVFLLLSDKPQRLGIQRKTAGRETASHQSMPVSIQPTLFQALRTRHFWMLVGALLFAAIGVSGCSLHLVPYMTDRGMSPTFAATILGVIGISSTVARILVGWLIDRVFAPRLAAAIFFSSALICLLFLVDLPVAVTGMSAAVVLGFALGTEIDVMAFLASRYFGTRSFAAIYGSIHVAFSVGVALGPTAVGFGFDRFGSYNLPFIFASICLIVSSSLFLLLGPYPGVGDPSSKSPA